MFKLYLKFYHDVLCVFSFCNTKFKELPLKRYVMSHNIVYSFLQPYFPNPFLAFLFPVILTSQSQIK